MPYLIIDLWLGIMGVLLAWLLVWLWRAISRSPCSGPAALGKAMALAALGGPYIQATVALFMAAMAQGHEQTTALACVQLLITVASAHASGYLAAHTREDTQRMNAWLHAVLGGVASGPLLFLLDAFRLSPLGWWGFGLFFPCAMIGSVHRIRRGPRPAAVASSTDNTGQSA